MSPRDNEDLERQLESIRFEPRASLGPEIQGRAARGEEPKHFPNQRRRILILTGLMAAGVGALSLGLVALEARSKLTVDRCCQDLDGGGDADDGVVVVSRHGVTVKDLKIYEDRDRSGGYSAGDPVRFIRQDTPVIDGRAEGTQTTEFCCLDYDGGGASDDALLVISRPPDRITMAAIIERGPAAQHPAVLR